jgi:hypothetical protein
MAGEPHDPGLAAAPAPVPGVIGVACACALGPVIALALVGCWWPVIAGAGLAYGFAMMPVARVLVAGGRFARPLRAVVGVHGAWLLPVCAPLAARVVPMAPWPVVLAAVGGGFVVLVLLHLLVTNARAARGAEAVAAARAGAGLVLALPCLAIIFVEAWGWAVPPIPAPMTDRPLAPVPVYDGAYADLFPAIDRWCSDHFAFRRPVIGLNALLQMELLHRSILPQVVIRGHQHWLFYGNDHVYADLQRAAPMPPAQVDQVENRVLDLADWCRAEGVACEVVIVPNKETVYPEYLPAHLRPPDGVPSRLDQFVARMSTHPEVALLDLRSALAGGKSWQRLYHRSDTHWNDCGAYVAAQAIGADLHARFGYPQVLPARDGLGVAYAPGLGGDLTNLLGLGGRIDAPDDRSWWVIAEDRATVAMPVPPRAVAVAPSPAAQASPGIVVQEYAVADPRLPRAFIMHDSFLEADHMPFLREAFSHSVFHHKDALVYRFDPAAIRAARPDVVILEFVERYVDTVASLEVPADAFRDGAARTVFMRGGAHGWDGFRPLHDIGGMAAEGDGSCTIVATGGDPGVLLPGGAAQAEKAFVLDLTIAAQQPSDGQVFWVAEAGQDYAEERSLHFPITAGWTTVSLTIPTATLAGALRLDPGNVPGMVRLARISLRGR